VGIPALFGREAAPARQVHGVGLSNVASRLRHMYGRDDLLTLRSSPDETLARLRLPS
jgi:sensor histidine kinase YesM